ncbi:MAG: NTP transferase domain-containing protein [Acidobacteria bacterium]|nr:NTP transferase domain-containing protein [Acidobacteriota bacterium]
MTGIVLTGGRSSRMGIPKALLAFDGKPLIVHIVRRLEPTSRVSWKRDARAAGLSRQRAGLASDRARDRPGPCPRHRACR